jgi:hypothetical protein
MGWIIFVVVLFIVLNSMRSKAAKARARMNQQGAAMQAQAQQPVQSSQSYQSAQSMQLAHPAALPLTGSRQFAQSMRGLQAVLSGRMPPGTVAQPGNASTYRPGNSPTYPPGESPTYQPGDSATYRPGNSSTYRPGDSPTYRPGDSPTYTPGNSPTYAPAGQIGSRPAMTAPAPMQGPQSTTAPQRDGDQSFQPTYASLTEIATAWRDQAVIDLDQRTAARTAPEQAPYQGSTAVTSTSLSSTLFAPYQPSSLMTSLSSSLSSSLMDSPPRMATSQVLSDVAAISLPVEVVEQVRFHLRNSHEVEAVRLVCDTMNVGLLEATKTVRSYA